MIKQVGNIEIKTKHPARCHCGSVVFEVDLPNGIVGATRCDCSICRMKGIIMAFVPLNGLRIVKGEDVLTLYQFNTMMARHYFCSRCGIYTHHQRRADPRQYAFNVACLEGVNPLELGSIAMNDGINHILDRGK